MNTMETNQTTSRKQLKPNNNVKQKNVKIQKECYKDCGLSLRFIFSVILGGLSFLIVLYSIARLTKLVNKIGPFRRDSGIFACRASIRIKSKKLKKPQK